jgi:hypothetical protein
MARNKFLLRRSRSIIQVLLSWNEFLIGLSKTFRCIELGFHGILKDFSIIKKSCGIESRLLWNLKKSCAIQLRQIRFFFQGNEISWYSIEISYDFKNVPRYSKVYRF